MIFFDFAKTVIPSIFKKKSTLLYPKEKKAHPLGLKGHIAIDESKCILCSKCQKACPADAIEVSRIEKTWTINPYRCITCMSCTYACPKKCLSMKSSPTSIAREKLISSHKIEIEEKKKSQ